jgi:AcrR family transcriptional regulator
MSKSPRRTSPARPPKRAARPAGSSGLLAGKGSKASKAAVAGQRRESGAESRPPQRSGRAASPTPAKTPRTKRPAGEHKAARRAAILRAGMHVFAEHGFEAARLDEVAARAGVAKGTLYLYFADKTALFEEIIRDAVAPLIARFEQLANLPDLPTAMVLDGIFTLFQTEVLGTDRKLILRLIISEGPRFPNIAQFYHREVVSRGLGILRGIAKRGVERGELPDDALVRFPQLALSAPLLAVLWDGLFARIEPLDTAGLLAAHRMRLTAGSKPIPDRSSAP